MGCWCVHEHGGKVAPAAGRKVHKSFNALLAAHETPSGSTCTRMNNDSLLARLAYLLDVCGWPLTVPCLVYHLRPYQHCYLHHTALSNPSLPWPACGCGCHAPGVGAMLPDPMMLVHVEPLGVSYAANSALNDLCTLRPAAGATLPPCSCTHQQPMQLMPYLHPAPQYPPRGQLMHHACHCP